MKTCRNCKEKFEATYNSMQKACSVPRALELVRTDKEVKRRKETLQMKREARQNDRGWWTKAAQTEFNKWVRLRDRDLPCISCQRHHTGQIHAGHYRTVGANPELRFEPLNCHAQCSVCNNHLSGNLINYRANLLVKIGAEKLQYLEGPHEAKKYTIQDLMDIRDKYKRLIKEMG